MRLLAPAAVLLDLKLPGLGGVELTRAIIDHHPRVRVVILTSFGEAERVRAALAAGAVGYVLKDAQPEEILMAVRTAVTGEVYLDPLVARRLTQASLGQDRGEPPGRGQGRVDPALEPARSGIGRD